MGWFSKKKEDAEDVAVANEAGDTGKKGKAGDKDGKKVVVKRDPRKAKRFFEHAEQMGEAKNYDYAIECYVNGFKHDPANMHQFEKLYDVALRRKVAGQKPAGMGEKWKIHRDPVDRMLAKVSIWAKDPLNPTAMIDLMESAIKADKVESKEVNLSELAYWVGKKILDGFQEQQNPKHGMYVQLRDLFSMIGAYGEAVAASEVAVELCPQGEERATLLKEQRDLEAVKMMDDTDQKKTAAQGGNVVNADEQEKIRASEGVVQTEQQAQLAIDTAREAWEKNKGDVTATRKYVDALKKRETDADDKVALQALKEAFDKSGEYSLRVLAGRVRLRQYDRHIRKTREALKNPETDNIGHLKDKLDELSKKKLALELKELSAQTEKYPQDMQIKFEYGRALFQAKKLDEAIEVFQKTQGAPKQRVQSLLYLGECYKRREWIDEAIDAFRKALETHTRDDELGVKLWYELMDALEIKARAEKDLALAQEAVKLSSKVLQANMKYRDIKIRTNGLRELVKQLSGQGAPS